MARDSQAALIALNRFGLGARGGASGDFVNAASDPRGFVKAELARPDGVLLQMPGLQSTPALAQAVFEYQFEVKQARDAVKTGAPMPDNVPPDVAARVQRRGLSLDGLAMQMAPKEQPKDPVRDSAKDVPASNANAAMSPSDAMQPNPAKPPSGLWPIQMRCTQSGQTRRNSRSTSFRSRFEPRRWRGCNAA